MACDDYLKEEKALKMKLGMLERELEHEKNLHRKDVADLNAEIEK